jgi:hypothetical protein
VIWLQIASREPLATSRWRLLPDTAARCVAAHSAAAAPPSLGRLSLSSRAQAAWPSALWLPWTPRRLGATSGIASGPSKCEAACYARWGGTPRPGHSTGEPASQPASSRSPRTGPAALRWSAAGSVAAAPGPPQRRGLLPSAPRARPGTLRHSRCPAALPAATPPPALLAVPHHPPRRRLLRINPEHHGYHAALRAVLLEEKKEEPVGGGQGGQGAALSVPQRIRLVGTYAELQREQPHGSAARRIPLDFLVSLSLECGCGFGLRGRVRLNLNAASRSTSWWVPGPRRPPACHAARFACCDHGRRA